MWQTLFLCVCPLLRLFLPNEISHYTESERPFIDLPSTQSFLFKPHDNQPVCFQKAVYPWLYFQIFLISFCFFSVLREHSLQFLHETIFWALKYGCLSIWRGCLTGAGLTRESERSWQVDWRWLTTDRFIAQPRANFPSVSSRSAPFSMISYPNEISVFLIFRTRFQALS